VRKPGWLQASTSWWQCRDGGIDFPL